MSLRFARRPRVRLPEGAPAPRRERRKLPAVVIPIAGYWLGMALLTHAVILVGKGEAAEPSPASELTEAAEPSPARELTEAAEPSPASEVTAAHPLASPGDAAFERAPNEEPPEPAPAVTPLAGVMPEQRASEPALEGPRALATAPRERAPRSAQNSAPARAAPAAAADGFAELFREEPPLTPPEPAPPLPSERESPVVSSGLPSCESVQEGASQDVAFEEAHARSPDLPADAFSRVLNHGGYLSTCSIPDGTSLDICVAVQAGRVRGVSVQARPHSAPVSACVARAAARLRFPHSPHLDIARTHFDALR